MDRDKLLAALRGFADQFRAQLNQSGPPSSEHAIHFCLALGFQAALDSPPGGIVFERPAGRGRIDLWIDPLQLAIEVKFRRPIPSGRNLPATQLFGSLLADFTKVARAQATHRLVVLVTDAPGLSYLERSGRGLLPLKTGHVVHVAPEDINALATTAATNAVADGTWTPLSAELLWEDSADQWHLLAWLVTTGP